MSEINEFTKDVLEKQDLKLRFVKVPKNSTFSEDIMENFSCNI
jgi:hypothetical protein